MLDKSGFVSQYAIHVRRAVLGSKEVHFKVGGRYGVYALYSGRRLYYVGLSKNVEKRLLDHLEDRHRAGWDNFSVFLLTDEARRHVRDLEAVLHRIYSAPGNSSETGFRVGADLTGLLRKAKPVRGETELQKYVLQGRIEGGSRLRLRYKDRVTYAKISSAGKIRFRGREYTSPSPAAIAAIDGRTQRNGWFWWEVERGPGSWVRLEKLRGP